MIEGRRMTGKPDLTEVHPYVNRMYKVDMKRGAEVPTEYSNTRRYREDRKACRKRRGRIGSSSEEEEEDADSSKRSTLSLSLSKRRKVQETSKERRKRIDKQWGTEVEVSGDESGEEHLGHNACNGILPPNADGSSGTSYAGSDCSFIDNAEVDEAADAHRILLRQSTMLEESVLNPPETSMEVTELTSTTLQAKLPKDKR